MWPLFLVWNLLGAHCAAQGKTQIRICRSCGGTWCKRGCPETL